MPLKLAIYLSVTVRVAAGHPMTPGWYRDDPHGARMASKAFAAAMTLSAGKFRRQSLKLPI